MTLQTQECPWCGSPISSERFVQIESKIRDEERKQLAEIEATLRQQLSKEKDAAEQLAADQIAAASADRDIALQKVKDSENREASIREQARAEALHMAQETNNRALRDQRETFELELATTRKSLAEVEAREAMVRAEARDQALKDVELTLAAERDKQRQLDEQKASLQAERDAALQRLSETEAVSAAARVESEEANRFLVCWGGGRRSAPRARREPRR